MPSALQTEFPYASLDFPGRTTVQVAEIAARLGYCVQHICNQIDQGLLTACDHRGANSSRASLRVPVEEYRKWVLGSLTGPATQRAEFLDALPKPVLIELQAEISRRINAA